MSTSSESALEVKRSTLIFKRDYLFSKLQKIYDISLKVKNNEIKREDYLSKCSELENLQARFEDTIMQLVEIQCQVKPGAKFSTSDLEAFDEMYSACLLEAVKCRKQIDSDSMKTLDTSSRPCLPKLTLVQFDGNIDNWVTFYDTFMSLVHNREFENIDKFHYLLSCVKGPALNIVKKLPITSANYNVVWQSLIDKYQDPRALVGRYLDRMLNFTTLTKGTPDNLNLFIEAFDHGMKAIEALKIKNLEDYLFCHIALRGLDHNTRKSFEESIDQNEIPTFNELITFVQTQIKVLEHASSVSSVTSQSVRKQIFNNNTKASRSLSNKTVLASSKVADKKLVCAHCKQNHSIYRCDQFRKLSVDARIDRVNSLKLCTNCLKDNHNYLSCQSTITCGVCRSTHHYLLHKELNSSSRESVVPVTSKTALTSVAGRVPTLGYQNRVLNKNSELHHRQDSTDYGVVLGTARLYVIDCEGYSRDCRAVIDSGAQSSFITAECAQRLGLPRKKCPFSVTGLSGEVVKNQGMVTVTLKPRHSDAPTFIVDMVVVSKVSSDMPNVYFPSHSLKKYSSFELADPTFYKRAGVDILLGNDIVSEIIKDKPLIINIKLPSVINTVFGFIVSGKLCLKDSNCNQTINLTSSFQLEQSLDKTLRNFWEIEELPCKPPVNVLDQLAEDIFIREYSREQSGCYVVPLPIMPNAPSVGDTRSMAERRLVGVERRLERTPVLLQAYSEFMREYEALGHMEPYSNPEPSKFIIPHHPILRPDSSSTPLRVVFDGSAKSSTNISLNDILLTGPKLYRDLAQIILNLRLFEHCLVSDVCKMYRAIKLDKKYRSYQHILYRNSPDDQVQVYELKTVTYGLSCSPFLAIRTMLQLASDEEKVYPMAAQVIREGTYMDDILWSCSTLDEACTLQDQLIACLKSGGFELKKWASNTAVLLQRVPDSQRECPITFTKDNSECTIKLLGLKWLPLSDNFYFSINRTDCIGTKRSVLSLLASIYDPIGFLSPCTFLAKCILQDLWKMPGISWDTPLPADVYSRWREFIEQLPQLGEMQIERHMLLPGLEECELVGFCDASSRGYAACVYVLSRRGSEVKVSLVTAKSKVAPIKPLTIPRLELMGAVLLSKLIKYVRCSLHRVKINNIIALTDSTIVLSWLNTDVYKLKTFVGNRVTQVTDCLPASYWRHVTTENNLADICSRGVAPAQLVADRAQWLTGSKWMYQPVDQWPVTYLRHCDNDSVELKSDYNTFNLFTEKSDNLLLESKIEFCERVFNNFSSYFKLQRCFARILRLSRSKRDVTQDNRAVLTTVELNAAQDVLIKLVQSAYFDKEISSLSKGCKYISTLRKLAPFLDSSGFLRVGGRITYSDLSFNAKHPRLLPKHSRLTVLLIDYLHVKYLHTGPRNLQNIIMQNFWILSCRSVVRSVLSKCKICFKCKPALLQPEMAPLPTTRLLPNKVFEHVGVDVAGPFQVKESLRRNAKVSRAYLCLFVCYSTKAVHLEVLTSLSADCFLAALDRFVARRGLCSFLYSDCGTNFVAASKFLSEVQQFIRNQETQNAIIEGCSRRQIIWKFNPPSAPHMGGLWEAGIKSAKYHLVRAVGDKSLTFEELSTVFCKIEAILNSRPLCELPSSSNADEFNVLTAGHFLIGRSLSAVPEYNLLDTSINRLSRWQYLQQCSQFFWKKWSSDYLNTLQQRAKWFKSAPKLNVGDLVLVKTDNVPSCSWPLARIVTLHPGADGIVRCVTLRTKKSTLQRPVNKLSPLPYMS